MTQPPPAPAASLPEIRVCVDPNNPAFGYVAITANRPGYAWLVGRPFAGAYWEADPEAFADWRPCSYDDTPPIVEPEPEAAPADPEPDEGPPK